MTTHAAGFDFADGILSVVTPCGSVAGGTTLVNGREVQIGPPSDGPWQLSVSEGPAQAFSLRLTNVGGAPVKLTDVVFARWTPDRFSAVLNTWEYRELIHGGSFHSINSGVKCVGRKTPWLDFVARSSMLTVYQREEGDALLLGVLPPLGEAFSEFVTLHSEPHCEGTFGFEIRHVFECVAIQATRSARRPSSPCQALVART